MYNLDAAKGDTGTRLDRFSGALFYSMLRAAGGNPKIQHGGVYCWGCPGSEAIRVIGVWAAGHDPDGNIRMEYARRMWNARAPGVDVVYLG